MLEGIVSDVLVRVLGSYVDGLNRESIRIGVWRGDLELQNLRLRPDALAVLFESLGLDLPVTVTAGYVGLLRLEVPWKSLRSAPVRIFMHDVTVVASPVSDGDQGALELREKRLKAARLATDEAIRDAKFSVRSMNDSKAKNPTAYPKESNPDNTSALEEVQQQGGYRIARWGWRFTSKFVTKIVDNIQVDVENVIVQYEDASSVRDRPYTATLAFDSLRACSTNSKWLPVFIESPSSPVVHKVVHMKGLVLNWEPGNSNNDLREWILREDVERERGKWSGFVQSASRHAIRPMDGELRIALTKSSAIASALAGTDDSLCELRDVPRVQMDLHFPDVKLVLDDFQYHTLLSTIMYLSDIDRKVRPQTAKGRWLWALDRLLPRFKERREAALRFNAEGMREFRECRERYCRVRNAVVRARRSGAPEPGEEAADLLELEKRLSYDDVVMFRDIADRELYESLDALVPNTTTTSRIWSFFSRGSKTPASAVDTGGEDASSESISGNATARASMSFDHPKVEAEESNRISRSRPPCTSTNDDNPNGAEGHGTEPKHVLHPTENTSSSTLEQQYTSQEAVVPNFRMGFLLGRGSIELKEGGYPTAPSPVSNLEFRELRLGIEMRPGSGLLLEALLGTFEVIDLRKNLRIMYQRVPWAGDFTALASKGHTSTVLSETSIPQLNALPEDHSAVQTELLNAETPNSTTSVSSDDSGPLCAILESYPHDITDAIYAIRGEYGLGLPVSDQHEYAYTMGYSPRFQDHMYPDSSPSSESFDPQHLKMKVGDDFRSCQTPLKYIAALRLNQEEVLDGDWAQGATRMAMDLAIGGMEVLLDGPEGAFISSVRFWHPREKMPSIMQFLAKSAAPRLATLRMDIQKAILERSVPMRMDILIRGPRFVMPARSHENVSVVLDLGTFAMETATGPSETVRTEEATTLNIAKEDVQTSQTLSIRYTDYKMACTDLGLYLLSDTRERAAERIIRPFSVHLLLQVMHNSSFIEAVTMSHQKLDVAKVKLQGELPSLQISVSHDGFRNILKVAKGWGTETKSTLPASGIEPNRAIHSLSIPAELEEIRNSHQNCENHVPELKGYGIRSRFISFSMNLDFEDLQLELRDSMARRIVTIPSSGTQVKMTKRPDSVDFDFRVRTFTVIDGSRGATAPFRQIAYAGMEMNDMPPTAMNSSADSFGARDCRSFISLSYHGDLVRQEQSLAVRILSLHLVCVRETYFALADFFYLNESHSTAFKPEEKSNAPVPIPHESRSAIEYVEEANENEPEDSQKEQRESEYSDPFAALGMTTSDAARVLRDQAGRGMEISKQAFADLGKLSVNAELDGLVVTLVTAEGAIACFDVSDCRTDLVQYANGAVEASGEVGGFGIRDLTSAFDVYSETIRYSRRNTLSPQRNAQTPDGWSLKVPNSNNYDIWLEARLRNIRIVYLHRFVVILKKYFDVLRESLRPVLEMKGGIAEVFDSEVGEDFPIAPSSDGRVRVRIITEDVDIVMPRHSQSPYEALRFVVSKSSITNDDLPTPGYRVGFEVKAEGVDAHVLYQPPAEGEGRALTKGGTEPTLKQITPDCPITDILPFSRGITIVAKLDTWRRRRVPEVILNAEGIPVLKDGQEEREYDPGKWLPTIRVRVSAPNGISARLCEAEYSILYFTFTENIIERPDIEFTDIVRGLKTPILPTRKPVQPIMFSSNRMPPNYKVLFEVHLVEGVIMSGADGRDELSKLIRSELCDLVGSFEYGVDYRMTIDVSSNMHSLQDARPFSKTHGMTLIIPTKEPTGMVSPHGENSLGSDSTSDMARSVTLTWDRPFGFRANVMVVASDLRIIVEPELFRDLGSLTPPGFPFLKSSAPPPLLRFNGRLLIVTISRPEIWLMANQYPGDGRALVIRGDVIAKVMWAAVTGRNTVEVAAHGVQINLSSHGPSAKKSLNSSTSTQPSTPSASTSIDRRESETPMLYSCDVSVKFEGRGYDPPKNPGDKPRKAPGSTLSVNAESFLVRIDVNDASLILAVGSRLVRLKPSKLSQRPEQPGRFDQWIDKGEEGDSKLSVNFMLQHCRLMFTDETLGRYVLIMEARLRNGVLRSNVPWLTNAAFEFALDLFNEDKGWWEPGIEPFPFEFASSKGRSGSLAIHVRAERNIDVNVTPNTVSGAARVSKALKYAVEDLRTRLKQEDEDALDSFGLPLQGPPMGPGHSTTSAARRLSVAAFCVRNETGRTMQMWLPYDSKRRSLRGNGGEIEVDTPSEEVLWTAMGATGTSSTDPAINRQLSMSCILALRGYEALTLSAEQTGSRLVRLIPDTTDNSNSGPGSLPAMMTLVWAVTMRDGVPCGCICSALRLVNRTRRLLEVNVGGIRKSMSVGNEMKVTPIQNFDSTIDCHGRIKPGEAWAVPIHSIFKVIRIRPHLLHASEMDKSNATGRLDDHLLTNSARCYEFLWSDPISNLSSLYETADDLRCNDKRNEMSGDGSTTTALRAPLLTCRGADSRKVFCLSVLPIVDLATITRSQMKDWISGSIDVQLCTPLVIENLLPRVVFVKLATPGNSQRSSTSKMIASKHMDPLSEAHIYGVGSDHSSLAIALGMDNSLDKKSRSLAKSNPALPSRQTGSFHPNFLTLKSLSTGSGRYTPFKVMVEYDRTVESRRVRLYCRYWIRNRSDTDIFFKDREHGRGSSVSNPKVFLRGCPPGVQADRYVCFSGGWIYFQRRDATEDIWVPLGTEISEVDKPVSLNLEGLSLLVDVRPAKGKFHRSLVLTIRNSVWLQNRTGSMLQWCQPAALIPHGIALASKVHSVGPAMHTAVHWDFRTRNKSICFRRATEENSSDWMWSRPVIVEGVQGEFAAKMYRPKRHEQYIARVVISKLGNGVSAIIVNKEDRNTPPYRIVNNCHHRSIAFRQSGVNETLPWLVRPGRSTRYAWDDPQAPVKRRSLVVEVIESAKETVNRPPSKSVSQQSLRLQESFAEDHGSVQQHARKKSRETRYPKFELNIDMIAADIPFTKGKKFVPELRVSVHVDGPTKVVTFTDQVLPSSLGDLETRKSHMSNEEQRSVMTHGGKSSATNVDVELFVKAIGVSFVDANPTELAYLSVSARVPWRRVAMAQCRPSLLTHRAQLDAALDAFSILDESAVQPQLVAYEAAVDHYLELPALLEPILPTHISALCALIERLLDVQHPSLPSLYVPSRALYALVKVRGVKNVISHFPHQVHHIRNLVPRFSYVEARADVASFWKLRYILLVWLSVAIRVPFPLHSILEPAQLDNAVNHARDALVASSGPIENAAVSFLSRLLARPDASHHRDTLISWAVSHTLSDQLHGPVRSAGLSFLAATFKHAPRQFTYPYLSSVLSAVDALVQDDIAASTIDAHLIAKLTQRLALTFLPPQPLAWRYVRQTRNLFSGTGHTGTLDPSPAAPLSATDAQSLELVIDLLLSALRHRDTVVRWSAAKGVARITARLPPALAADVVASVMQLFDQRAEARADAALHGACLALAELVRRGLILPHHDLFKRAFDAVSTAACFDMRRGANSVGSYVRDAACYAVWAIARAYDKAHVELFAHVICDAMIPVALLDREVNCRRAAAAALQECVGRLSEQLFEDGIQLITLADYFSLGDRNAAYLEIAPNVACLAGFKHFNCILQELWQRKLVHWDTSIRALSAKALARLVDVDRRGVIVKDVIPHLVELATQRGDMVYRHGSILGLAELSLIVGRKGLASLSTDVRRIPQLLEEKKLLTGRTGDNTRIACCQLIEGLARGAGDVFLADKDARTDAEYSLTFLQRILGCGKENMYAPAANAYSALCDNVIANDVEWHMKVTNKILDGISHSEYCESQRGFALAAGVCGNSPRLDYVVQVLCIELTRNADVEVRRNAAISLRRIPEHILSGRFTAVLTAMQCGMTDFAKDERGDVGSWVREASMKTVVEIVELVLKMRGSDKGGRLDDKEEVEVLGVIQCVAEQCCSRIDRTRGVAGSSMKALCQVFTPSVMIESLSKVCSLINSTLSVPFEQKICDEDSRDVDFREARTIFSYMKNTLDIPELFEPVVRGFVAAGGTPGQQSKPASKALGDFIADAKEMNAKTRTVTSILRLIDDKHPRLTIPALNLLGTLLKQDALIDLEQTALLSIARSTKRSWRQKLGDVKRVIAAINVLSELASLSITDDSFDFRKGTLGRECLEGLSILLGGPIPRLRRISAEAIYLVLLEFDADTGPAEEGDREHDVSAKVQEALAMVSETGWEQLDVTGARERRNVLCQLLGIRIPVPIRKQP